MTRALKCWLPSKRQRRSPCTLHRFVDLFLSVVSILLESRRGGSFAAANIDVTNEELFPTLAAASEIEKNKKEDTKPGQGW